MSEKGYNKYTIFNPSSVMNVELTSKIIQNIFFAKNFSIPAKLNPTLSVLITYRLHIQCNMLYTEVILSQLLPRVNIFNIFQYRYIK